jgi:hypothetical protein
MSGFFSPRGKRKPPVRPTSAKPLGSTADPVKIDSVPGGLAGVQQRMAEMGHGSNSQNKPSPSGAVGVQPDASITPAIAGAGMRLKQEPEGTHPGLHVPFTLIGGRHFWRRIHVAA